MAKPDTPPGGWLSPNTPDPEGRDLLDDSYAPAAERKSLDVAAGTNTNAKGQLVWRWRKIKEK